MGWRTKYRARWPLVALCVAVAPACSKIDKPPPPDMTSLIESYREPTGVLNDETIGPAYESLNATFGFLKPICGWDDDVLTEACQAGGKCFLCDGLDPMSQAFTSVSESDEGARELSSKISGIEGYMKMTRICPGFGAEPTLNKANGVIDLTIGFTSRGIDPVFGGTMNECQVLINDVPTTMDGDISIAYERSFFLDELDELEPIVRFRGTISNSGGSDDFDANLQFSPVEGANFAVVFDVPDEGSYKFVNGVSGTGIEAANGRFSCVFTGPEAQPMICTNVATGEVVQ
ncbi:MAG: hypothetical protein QM778_22660 [Myxococcales bacterium]